MLSVIVNQKSKLTNISLMTLELYQFQISYDYDKKEIELNYVIGTKQLKYNIKQENIQTEDIIKLVLEIHKLEFEELIFTENKILIDKKEFN